MKLFVSSTLLIIIYNPIFCNIAKECSMNLSASLDTNIRQLHRLFPIGKSYDIITRELYAGKTRCYFIGINGFCDNEMLLKILTDLQNQQIPKNQDSSSLSRFMAAKIGYVQTEAARDYDTVVKEVLSGASALFLDGFSSAIILDTRSYPARGIEEPDAERVTRGAKDGFVETLVFNTCLIRRRIRNPKLTFSVKTVGRDSKTDVAIAYVDGLADQKLLDKLTKAIESLPISALTMGAKSLEELLIPKSRLHPLPQIRFTERPDVACSFLLEGYILVLVDNSPTAMVFPCNLFQFTQNPDDYYQNSSIGNYFRVMRFICIFLSIFLMPLFLLLGIHNVSLPGGFQIVSGTDHTAFQMCLYVLIIELGLDLFNYSSSLAPGGYSHSLGLIGGLLIGQIAVDLHWLSIEALFYGAATMLASICISSKELSDALRLYRLFLILLTALFDVGGFIGATVLILLSIGTTKTFSGNSYLWPLIPLDPAALHTLLVRCPTPDAQLPNNKRRYQQKQRG